MNSIQKFLKKGGGEDKEKLLKDEKKDKMCMKPNQYGKNFTKGSCQNNPYHKFKNEKDVGRK